MMNIDQDFIDFFGQTREEIMSPYKNIKNDNEIKRKNFPKHNIPIEELYKIYKDSDYYTTMLRYISPDCKGWLENIKNAGIEKNDIFLFLKDRNPQNTKLKILDYGCGHGIYGIYAAHLGHEVTLADIPHKHFQFLKYLCKKYLPEIKFYAVPCSNALDFDDKYDFIINSEVLEHCDEPAIVLASLIKAMKDDGVMYLSTFFNNINFEDTSHLHKNTIRYENTNNWWKVVNELGLKCVKKDPRGCEKLFGKV